jgi:hypothetical protein
MTQQQGTAAGQSTGAGRDEGAPPWPRLVVVAAGFVAGAVAVYLFGLDSVWPTLTGGVITAALAFGADLGIARAAATVGRRARVVQVAAVFVLAVGVALFYRSERVAAFERVFGMTPPAGVRHVDVHRVIGSDTKKKLLVLDFECDRATMESLVTPRQFKERVVEMRPGREAKGQRGVWMSAFVEYGSNVLERWKNRLPVTEPVIYRWSGTDRETMGEHASVLWDAATGRGCAIHARP